MKLEEVVETGLKQGNGSVVLAEETIGLNFRLANNTVTTNGHEESISAGVAVIDGERVGIRASDLSGPQEVVQLCRMAGQDLQGSPPAPDAMPLASAQEAAPAVPPGKASQVGPEQLRSVLASLGRALERSRADGLRCYGYAQLSSTRELLGLNTGARLEARRQSGSVALTLKTEDLKRSVWAGGMAAAMESIDVDAIYAKLRQRLDWTERRVELPAGHYEVLLEPSATADLMLRLYWEMYARGADESRTVFAAPDGGSRVGERMYSPDISMDSDPADPRMPVPAFTRTLASNEYASVFDCGLPVPATSWIEGGVQQELICPRRWARDHGHPVRLEVENLRMRGGERTLEQMIADTKRALLVTSFWYIREVDPSALLLTGLTRDGVFLIENGEVVGAVNNFRFNESPVGVFSRTAEIGRAGVTLPREMGEGTFVEAPPVRVERFFMSSVSDAI